jgi:hypothetical protein
MWVGRGRSIWRGRRARRYDGTRRSGSGFSWFVFLDQGRRTLWFGGFPVTGRSRVVGHLCLLPREFSYLGMIHGHASAVTTIFALFG